jgi:glycosyltransferase involved in cell wall biosynthesis
MRVWLIQTGDPLPIDGEVPRLMRTGLTAQLLADRGHDVTWWCSTFNHWTKTHRFPSHATVELTPAYRLRLIHSPGYRRNVSLARVFDHRVLAKNFRDAIERDPLPDVIVSSLPTIEMAEIASIYGNKNNVPVITDVRDLWPDAFINLVPRLARPFARVALTVMQREARRALAKSDVIVSISESYMQWALDTAQRKRRDSDAIFPLGYERSTPSEADLNKAGHRLRQAGVNPGKTVCWFIGTFGRTYELGTVVQVAKALHEKNDERAQFILSGTGPRLQEFRNRAAGLPNVVFTGWLNSTEIEWMMKVADIGLAAYVRDAPQGLPNKLFEYLAGGLAILSSLGPEAAELLESNGCGLTYMPENAESLMTALTRLLDDPLELSRMKSAARNTFDQKFSSRHVYKPLIEFIERVGMQSERRMNGGS